jgi:biotin carboxyl carrier protein
MEAFGERGGGAQMTYEVVIDGVLHKVELQQDGARWQCKVDDQVRELDVAVTARDVLSIIEDGRQYEVKREYSLSGETHMILGSERFAAEVRDPRSLRSRRAHADAAHGPVKISAPMSGKVVRVIVSEGEEVEAGAGVIVVEAMKMQNEIKSPKKGTVRKLAAREGATVNAGETLAVVE